MRYAASEVLQRQRFAIAHSLGHFVLHRNRAFYDSIDKFSARTALSEEKAANRFALELLIPEGSLKDMIKTRKESDISALVGVFCVSEVALRERLRQLGYVS